MSTPLGSQGASSPGPAPELNRRSKKLNVVIPPRDYDVLQSIAQELGVTISVLVRDALKMGLVVQLELLNGNQIVVNDQKRRRQRDLTFIGETAPLFAAPERWRPNRRAS